MTILICHRDDAIRPTLNKLYEVLESSGLEAKDQMACIGILFAESHLNLFGDKAPLIMFGAVNALAQDIVRGYEANEENEENEEGA